MTTKLLVVMDSGRFKAYRLEDSSQFTTPRLRPLEEWQTDVNERISDQVTDQAGQFSKGSMGFVSVGDMADGERHNLELERRRRALKNMAARINQLVQQEPGSSCYIAAGKEINHAVWEALDRRTQESIVKNVVANLTKLTPREIIEHFCPPRPQNHRAS